MKTPPLQKKRTAKAKPINWSKVYKKSKEIEDRKDAVRAVELIKELYNLVIIKHKNND